MRYIVTAFIFLLLGGIEALLMRIPTGAARTTRFLGPDRYNQIFTTHGTTMMFLFAVPDDGGHGIYLVPLMLGTRNVAFPRLNAFGYWMYLFGGIFLYWGVFTNTAPDAGWFAYPPLPARSSRPASESISGPDDHVHEVSAMCVAAELIATIFKMRAPGMSLNRIPVYCWSMLVQSFMVIFAMPAVMIASSLSCCGPDHRDPFRKSGRRRRSPPLSARVLVLRPSRGVHHLHSRAGLRLRHRRAHSRAARSSVTRPWCSRRSRPGSSRFGLWVHHMFATGLPQIGEAISLPPA